jgi:hypothetical protein
MGSKTDARHYQQLPTNSGVGSVAPSRLDGPAWLTWLERFGAHVSETPIGNFRVLIDGSEWQLWSVGRQIAGGTCWSVDDGKMKCTEYYRAHAG